MGAFADDSCKGNSVLFKQDGLDRNHHSVRTIADVRFADCPWLCFWIYGPNPNRHLLIGRNPWNGRGNQSRNAPVLFLSTNEIRSDGPDDQHILKFSLLLSLFEQYGLVDTSPLSMGTAALWDDKCICRHRQAGSIFIVCVAMTALFSLLSIKKLNNRTFYS